jgi:hypothetical protein
MNQILRQFSNSYNPRFWRDRLGYLICRAYREKFDIGPGQGRERRAPAYCPFVNQNGGSFKRAGSSKPMTQNAVMFEASGYFTARVTPVCALTPPMVTASGTLGPGETPSGTCALICNAPAIRPGAAPT